MKSSKLFMYSSQKAKQLAEINSAFFPLHQGKKKSFSVYRGKFMLLNFELKCRIQVDLVFKWCNFYVQVVV